MAAVVAEQVQASLAIDRQRIDGLGSVARQLQGAAIESRGGQADAYDAAAGRHPEHIASAAHQVHHLAMRQAARRRRPQSRAIGKIQTVAGADGDLVAGAIGHIDQGADTGAMQAFVVAVDQIEATVAPASQSVPGTDPQLAVAPAAPEQFLDRDAGQRMFVGAEQARLVSLHLQQSIERAGPETSLRVDQGAVDDDIAIRTRQQVFPTAFAILYHGAG